MTQTGQATATVIHGQGHVIHRSQITRSCNLQVTKLAVGGLAATAPSIPALAGSYVKDPRVEVHTILRARLCAAHMGGFLGRNSLNKG